MALTNAPGTLILMRDAKLVRCAWKATERKAANQQP
jgi:hypothetical protein